MKIVFIVVFAGMCICGYMSLLQITWIDSFFSQFVLIYLWHFL